jgi:hypothetical protein
MDCHCKTQNLDAPWLAAAQKFILKIEWRNMSVMMQVFMDLGSMGYTFVPSVASISSSSSRQWKSENQVFEPSELA